MRRLLLLVIASAMAFSACGQGKGWPDASQSAAPTLAATSSPTAAPTATPTTAPTATATPRATPRATTKPVATDTPAATDSTAVDADWTQLAPANMGFTSLWPGEPTKKTQNSTSTWGPTATSMWEYDDGLDLSYFIVVAQYPKGAMTGKSPATVYDTTVKGMTTASTITLTIADQGDATFNGHTGRGFTLTSDTANVQGAMILVGDALYMVYVAYSPAVTDLSSPKAFYDDFVLTI